MNGCQVFEVSERIIVPKSIMCSNVFRDQHFSFPVGFWEKEKAGMIVANLHCSITN